MARFIKLDPTQPLRYAPLRSPYTRADGSQDAQLAMEDGTFQLARYQRLSRYLGISRGRARREPAARTEGEKPIRLARVRGDDLFAPEGGVEVAGTRYQGGEPLGGDDLSTLTQRELRELSNTGAHRDPARAEEDLQHRPAFTREEREAGRRLPRVGKSRPLPYRDTPVASPLPPAQAGRGRHQLPKDLRHPSLLTEEEAARISHPQAVRLVHLFNQLPPDLEYEQAARAGRSKRNWYQQAASSLYALFGEQAERFAAVLAATSPMTAVQDNLRQALHVWTLYQGWAARHEHQHPSYEEARTLLARWREGGQLGTLRSLDNGIARALSFKDLGADTPGVLEGPKTESFRRNLLGNLVPVTQDAWMSYFGDFPQKQLGKMTAGYLASNVKVRRVANRLNASLRPGEAPWTPAEVQAAVWTSFRALAMVGGRSRVKGPKALTPLEALAQLTHADVRAAADFLSLLRRDTHTHEALQKLGLGANLNRLLQAAEQAPGPRGRVAAGLSGERQQALERVARRAGQFVSSFGTTQKLFQYARKRDNQLVQALLRAALLTRINQKNMPTRSADSLYQAIALVLADLTGSEEAPQPHRRRDGSIGI